MQQLASVRLPFELFHPRASYFSSFFSQLAFLARLLTAHGDEHTIRQIEALTEFTLIQDLFLVRNGDGDEAEDEEKKDQLRRDLEFIQHCIGVLFQCGTISPGA
ncbi:hypothetical protein PsorP6_009402 [Peronosclerospora sorghi]|uniref:Uncharacterized protein n=1 Tax=Peronosclerospora sorghi TaxID=230839 RepID=A0ACC0VXJ7_9STRA|nr:hypothetical protein PsorP6_009402 [Peronosclerospora sorghi]